MTNGTKTVSRVGRPKEIDDLAVFLHFRSGIERGNTVEAVGNAGFTFAGLKQCPDSRSWEYRAHHLASETAKRRFRAVNSHVISDACRMAPDWPAGQVDDMVRQIHANMKPVGGLAQIPVKMVLPLILAPGRPKKIRGKRI